MMWAICCSLAFCTFQIVFANTLDDDISASRDTLTLQLSDVRYKAFSDVGDVAKAVKIKEIKWPDVFERCTSTDFDQRFAKSYADKSPKCDQCYHEAKNTEEIQIAKKCCQKLIAELKEDSKVYIAQAKTCVAKCARDGTKCLEELKNIQKRKIEEYLDSVKDDSKNV